MLSLSLILSQPNDFLVNLPSCEAVTVDFGVRYPDKIPDACFLPAPGKHSSIFCLYRCVFSGHFT